MDNRECSEDEKKKKLRQNVSSDDETQDAGAPTAPLCAVAEDTHENICPRAGRGRGLQRAQRPGMRKRVQRKGEAVARCDTDVGAAGTAIPPPPPSWQGSPNGTPVNIGGGVDPPFNTAEFRKRLHDLAHDEATRRQPDGYLELPLPQDLPTAATPKKKAQFGEGEWYRELMAVDQQGGRCSDHVLFPSAKFPEPSVTLPPLKDGLTYATPKVLKYRPENKIAPYNPRAAWDAFLLGYNPKTGKVLLPPTMRRKDVICEFCGMEQRSPAELSTHDTSVGKDFNLSNPSAVDIARSEREREYCCVQYFDWCQWMLENMVKTREMAKKSKELIDISPSLHFGSKAARKAAKNRVLDNLRYRDVMRTGPRKPMTNYYELALKRGTHTVSLSLEKALVDPTSTMWVVPERPSTPSPENMAFTTYLRGNRDEKIAPRALDKIQLAFKVLPQILLEIDEVQETYHKSGKLPGKYRSIYEDRMEFYKRNADEDRAAVARYKTKRQPVTENTLPEEEKEEEGELASKSGNPPSKKGQPQPKGGKAQSGKGNPQMKGGKHSAEMGTLIPANRKPLKGTGKPELEKGKAQPKNGTSQPENGNPPPEKGKPSVEMGRPRHEYVIPPIYVRLPPTPRPRLCKGHIGKLPPTPERRTSTPCGLHSVGSIPAPQSPRDGSASPSGHVDGVDGWRQAMRAHARTDSVKSKLSNNGQRGPGQLFRLQSLDQPRDDHRSKATEGGKDGETVQKLAATNGAYSESRQPRSDAGNVQEGKPLPTTGQDGKDDGDKRSVGGKEVASVEDKPPHTRVDGRRSSGISQSSGGRDQVGGGGDDSSGRVDGKAGGGKSGGDAGSIGDSGDGGGDGSRGGGGGGGDRGGGGGGGDGGGDGGAGGSGDGAGDGSSGKKKGDGDGVGGGGGGSEAGSWVGGGSVDGTGRKKTGDDGGHPGSPSHHDHDKSSRVSLTEESDRVRRPALPSSLVDANQTVLTMPLYHRLLLLEAGGHAMNFSDLNVYRYDTRGMFILQFPDGSSHCYYPSGHLALTTSRSVDGGLDIFVYAEPTFNKRTRRRCPPQLLAFFCPTRSTAWCYRANGSYRLALNKEGGVLFNEAGSREKHWAWVARGTVSHRINAPLFRPLAVTLSPYFSLRIVRHDSIHLTYTHGQYLIRYNVSFQKHPKSEAMVEPFYHRPRMPKMSIVDDYIKQKLDRVRLLVTKINQIREHPCTKRKMALAIHTRTSSIYQPVKMTSRRLRPLLASSTTTQSDSVSYSEDSNSSGGSGTTGSRRSSIASVSSLSSIAGQSPRSDIGMGMLSSNGDAAKPAPPLLRQRSALGLGTSGETVKSPAQKSPPRDLPKIDSGSGGK